MQFVHVSVTVPSVIVQLPPSQVIFALSALPPLEMYFEIALRSAEYAASPATAASFVGYSYPAAVPQALSAAAPAGTTFLQYQPPQLQPDRMQ